MTLKSSLLVPATPFSEYFLYSRPPITCVIIPVMASPEQIGFAESDWLRQRDLRRILNVTPQMLTVLDPDGRISWQNDFALDYFGINLAGLSADDVRAEIIHSDDRQKWAEDRERGLPQGMPFETEQRMRGKDGKYRWFLMRYEPLKDAEGRVIRWYVGSTDIEDRKRADEVAGELQRREAALQESEEQWRAAFESNPTMYFMVDKAGVIVSVNTFGAEQLGYTISELVGQPVLNVFYEPDREAVQGHANACFGQPGRMMKWEARKIRKDGSMLSVRETANAIVLKDRPVLLVICEDITEQKRAEEAARRSEKELRKVVETIPAMAWSALPDGSSAFVTRQWTEYTGLSAQQTSGLGWQSTVHPEDLASHNEEWRRCSVTGQPFEHETRLRRAADGQYRWFLIRGTPQRDEQGNISKWYGLATDIEDRKHAEQALRRSEAYLAESQRLTKTGSWAYNPFTGRTLYWSDEMFRICGIDPQEGPSSAKFWQRVHPEDLDRVRERVEREARDKTEYVDEYRMVLPDGVVKHILDIGRPVFNGAGDVGEFVGTTVDVTERRRAEETLRRSEAYLAEAQRLTHTGSWAYVPATEKAIYWSKEMFRIFDLDPQQGPPAAETVLQRIHPEDRDSTLGIFRKAALEKTELEHHHRLVLLDGTVKYIHVIGHPVFDLSGQVIEFVGTNVDETERKRAEEEVRTAETRFRASVDHLTDALFIHDDQDDQGRVMDVNQQACESLGYTREELIGMTAFDYDAFVDAGFMRSIKERVARGEIFSFESVHRRKDGTTFPVEVRARPFWHGDHRFGLALVRDITDRKRAQAERERLRQLEAELTHMNRVSMMGELAASIAHELNQPLSGVVVNGNACLRWLAGHSPNLEEARENARRIVRDGKRAGDIIGRIRALATKTATAMARLDMNETVQEVIALGQTEVRRNGVTPRTELAKDLSPVLGDRVQLQQVVLNLVMNAVEAMSTVGERPRELVIRTQNDEADMIRITVQDSGVGLDPQSMQRVFDAFYTTKSGGMGMGLSICRSIVQNHGGRLWAVANDGPGTTFQFTVQNYDSAARKSVAGA